jgi:outer membrane immunogenic protein
MRKQLLCGVAVVAVTVGMAGPMRAADMPMKAAPPAPVVAPPSWTGFYLGGTLGYGWTKMSGVESSGDTFAGNANLHGALVGVHSGYNWQFNQWVLGIESDYSGTLGTSWSKEVCTVDDGNCGSFMHGELHGLASIRGRIGWAFDRTLIYATGGVGWGFFRGFVNSGTSIQSPTSKTVTGGVIGGGIEWKYNPNLSFRLEGFDYLFNKTWGQDSDTPFSQNSVSVRNVGVIRFGASYYF